MKKTVYISGKITGLDISVAEAAFEEMEIRLNAVGHKAINPCKILPYHPDYKWEEYMLADIKMIFECNAMVMLDNWETSRGAKIEHAIAIHLGLEIYYPKMHHYLMP